jgi:hypothetical protein
MTPFAMIEAAAKDRGWKSFKTWCGNPDAEMISVANGSHVFSQAYQTMPIGDAVEAAVQFIADAQNEFSKSMPMKNPKIPTIDCFKCGKSTNETQSVYGVGHRECFIETSN